MSEQPSSRLFQCPGEPQPIDRAVHLARLERGYPKCRTCPFREELGQVSERRLRGIRTILFESEPMPADRFVVKGIESQLDDTARFERWAARFGLWLRGEGEQAGTANRHLLPFRQNKPAPFSPHVLLADATARTVPDFVAAVSAGLRWAGCDVTDLGRGAVGLLHFAQKRLGAEAGLLLGQPGVWEHECGVSVEGLSDEIKLPDLLDEAADDPPSVTDRPTRQLGRLERTSMTKLYLESFADRYHALRPLRIALYTSCVPVADALRRLTAPFDIQLEVFPYSVALREDNAIDLTGAHFGVYIDGTGRVVELLDEQGVPLADSDDLSDDAVEVVTAVQILMSRTETPLSELTFHSTGHDKKSGF